MIEQREWKGEGGDKVGAFPANGYYTSIVEPLLGKFLRTVSRSVTLRPQRRRPMGNDEGEMANAWGLCQLLDVLLCDFGLKCRVNSFSVARRPKCYINTYIM